MKFKRWEASLMLLSVVLAVAALTFLKGERRLYPLLLGMKDWSNLRGVTVGKVSRATGDTKIQAQSASVFVSLLPAAPVDEGDLIFTGTQSSAIILLNDQSTIELGSNTLVRITQENKFGFSGVSRAPILNVFMGNVKVQASQGAIMMKSSRGKNNWVQAHSNSELTVENTPYVMPADEMQNLTPSSALAQLAPVETPSPKPQGSVPQSSAVDHAAEVIILSPEQGSLAQLSKGTSVLHYLLGVEIKVNAESELRGKLIHIVVTKLGKKSVVQDQEISVENNKAVAQFKLKSPGDYLVTAGNAQSQFKLKDEFEGITLYPPKVGGLPLDVVKNEIHTSDNYDVSLRWEPLPKVKEYTVLFAAPEHPEKIISEKKSRVPFYSFNIGKVFQGSFLYKVTARDSTGFKAVSQWDLFQFVLKSPSLTLPLNGSEWEEDATVELVWSKTSFSDAYDLEIYSDAELKKLVLSKRVKDNFYYLKNLKSGVYFWRTRAVSRSVLSGYSATGTFTVKN